METIDKQFSTTPLTISAQSRSDLHEAANWALFLSILGFISLGIMIIGGTIRLLQGNSIARSAFQLNFIVLLIYLFFVITYFIAAFYLFQFSRKMKVACKSLSQTDLENGIGNLKSFFKFVGIFTMLTVAVYVMFFVIALIAFGSNH